MNACELYLIADLLIRDCGHETLFLFVSRTLNSVQSGHVLLGHEKTPTPSPHPRTPQLYNVVSPPPLRIRVDVHTRHLLITELSTILSTGGGRVGAPGHKITKN